MNSRQSKRQTQIESNPPVPLASYGIKIYGREYQKFPTRYDEDFQTVRGSTCNCSTAKVLHARYRSAMNAMGYDTELPLAADGEASKENTQQARDIQKRAIDLYRQTIGDNDSKGPAEYDWRLEIENLVFGRFRQRYIRLGTQQYTFTNTRTVRFQKAKGATS